MELELGLKITKNVDDVCTDFRIAKDRGGIIFVSNETETMFVLTANLRGYRMENIKIHINDDATLITISGEKHVQEMLMKSFIMHKKEIEMKRFSKVFKIPRDVILDLIKARLDEIDSTLTIYMPKFNKGIIGSGVQEVESEQSAGSQYTQKCDRVEEVKGMLEKAASSFKEEVSTSREAKDDKGQKPRDCDEIEEVHGKGEASYDCRHEIKEEDNYEGDEIIKASDEQNELDRSDDDNKCSMFFSPCLFIGGAFIVSLVVLVRNFVRSKRQEKWTPPS